MSPFAVVLLAAGESRRMGRLKQLLPYRDGTLVEHAAQTALDSGASQVVVVLGAHAQSIRAVLYDEALTLIENPDWSSGMGRSIACGVSALNGVIEAVLIVLVDQPHVTAEHLRTLAGRAQPASASQYDGVLGAPCAFARSEFPRLLALTGDQGARLLLRGGELAVQAVPFEAGLLDLDTVEAFEAFLREDVG